jgi:hypothetical protein
MENNSLYGWLFAYNPYAKQWYAAEREDYFKMFSDIKDENILKSSDIDTLKYLINKFGGDKKKINKFIKTQKA